jgi:hypothetical protein
MYAAGFRTQHDTGNIRYDSGNPAMTRHHLPIFSIRACNGTRVRPDPPSGYTFIVCALYTVRMITSFFVIGRRVQSHDQKNETHTQYNRNASSPCLIALA